MFLGFVNTAEFKPTTYTRFGSTQLPFLCLQYVFAHLGQYQGVQHNKWNYQNYIEVLDCGSHMQEHGGDIMKLIWQSQTLFSSFILIQ
jgi:hypothetical protein